MSSKKIFFILVFLNVFPEIQSQNRFSNDSLLCKIYDLSYNRKSKELISFFTHADKKYREAACLAFASVEDSNCIEPLFKMLRDDKEFLVKRAALYSLSQYRLASVSKQLIKLNGKKSMRILRSEFLEAIGKGAGMTEMSFFEKFKLRMNDSAERKAFVYGVYRAYRRKTLSANLEKKLQEIYMKDSSAETGKLCFILLKKSAKSIPKAVDDKTDSISFSEILNTPLLKQNPYWMIKAMEMYSVRSEILYKAAFESSFPFVFRTWAMEKYLERKTEISIEEYSELLRSNNIAFISMACEKLRNDSSFIKKGKEMLPLIKDIESRLEMPRDFETRVDIEKTIAGIEGKEYRYKSYFETGYSNPPDWTYIKSIASDQHLRLTTSKGIIILECMVNDAPVSVSHFLKCIDSGYYNGKYFHRFVSDFVIQGGCPRGDGWGTLNWIQRSEFSNYLQYEPGSVGLASAGKDSEGVQFFVTHTWTPHLDGRYTLFAKVVYGMKIVNRLELGDRILKIEKL